jgi:hypothetical protein
MTGTRPACQLLHARAANARLWSKQLSHDSFASFAYKLRRCSAMQAHTSGGSCRRPASKLLLWWSRSDDNETVELEERDRKESERASLKRLPRLPERGLVEGIMLLVRRLEGEVAVTSSHTAPFLGSGKTGQYMKYMKLTRALNLTGGDMQ